MTPEAIGKLVAEAIRPLRQRLSDLEGRRDESIDLAKSIGRQEALVDELRRGMDRQPDVKALVDAEVSRIEEALAKSLQEMALKAEGWQEALKSLESKHQEEIVALRKEWENASASAAEATEGLSASFSGEIEGFEARLKAAEDSFEEQIAERDTKIEALEKSLSEVLAAVDEVGISVKALTNLEIPQVPEEVIALPEQFEAVRKQVGEALQRVDQCMRFEGRWDESETYKVGATVAEKNSLWVAVRDNPGTPGSSDSGWELAMKSGKLVTPYEHR